MRRNRREYLLGYAAGQRAARREFEDEFAAIRRDLAASRAHLDTVVALDQLGELMALEHESMSVH
jgi:hypothetical protein